MDVVQDTYVFLTNYLMLSVLKIVIYQLVLYIAGATSPLKKFLPGAVVLLAATKQLYKWYFPSVRPSVCPSHLFDYVPIIVSTQNFQALLPMTKSDVHGKSHGQRSKVKAAEVKNLVKFDPDWPFPDCVSSLNSPMATEWWTKLKVV